MPEARASIRASRFVTKPARRGCFDDCAGRETPRRYAPPSALVPTCATSSRCSASCRRVSSWRKGQKDFGRTRSQDRTEATERPRLAGFVTRGLAAKAQRAQSLAKGFFVGEAAMFRSFPPGNRMQRQASSRNSLGEFGPHEPSRAVQPASHDRDCTRSTEFLSDYDNLQSTWSQSGSLLAL
jgi:hypothetical protein